MSQSSLEQPVALPFAGDFGGQFAPHAAKVIRDAADTWKVMRPGHRIDIIVRETTNVHWLGTNVREGRARFAWEDVSPGYVGFVSAGDMNPDAPAITLRITVSAAPTKTHESPEDAPWQVTRKLAPLYRISPLAYETLRDGYDQYASWRDHRQLWHSLPYCDTIDRTAPEAATGKRPAILIGMHFLEMGGAEKLGFDCVEWALEAGLRVFVVAERTALHRRADRLPDHPDVTFLRADIWLPHHDWGTWLEHFVAEENIRLVHIHHCGPLYGNLAHLRATAPHVEVIDSTHIIEYRNGGFPRASGTWTNYIDLHHVISNDLATMYMMRFGVVDRVKLGRMLDGATQTPPEPNLTPGQDHLTLTFIGRLFYQKRPITAVLVLRSIHKWARRQGLDLKVNFVGDGPFLNEVQRLSAKWGLADVITFHPGGADVPALLSGSDILLLPSANEGLALVCYEAIAHGAIPISTNVGGQGELLPEELMTAQTPIRTVPQMTKIVRKLWEDGRFLDQMVAKLHDNYARISKDPTAREVLMPLYEAVAEGRSIRD
ncbi:glycosyltransferase [Paracoccaceae bacterium GXU_MW_L88]